MQINKLTIQGFRGIRDEVSFNLSAPLTIILAPNGTGKTSICDSVEWLLSGNVERLSDVEDEPLRCKFSSKDTFIEAVLSTPEDSLSLKRQLKTSSSSLSRKVSEGKYKVLRDIELLSTIVPDVNIGRTNQSHMSSWLRATRFLESDSLNLLIDNDESSHGTRKLMFSNLFGVKDLQEKERHLVKIKDDIGAESTLNKNLSRVILEIGANRNELGKIGKDASLPYFEMANKYLLRVSELISTPFSGKGKKTLENFEALRIKFLGLSESNKIKKAAYSFINTNFEIFLNNLKELKNVSTRLSKLQEEKEEKEESLIALELVKNETSEKLDEKQQQISDNEDFVKWFKLNQRRILSLSEVLQKGCQDKKIPSCDSRELSIRADSLQSKIDQQTAKVGDIENSNRNIQNWLKLASEQRRLETEISDLNILIKDKEPNTPFEKQLSQLKAKIETLAQGRLEQLNDINIILSSGHTFVGENPEVDVCPLCDQKYSSHIELLSRISDKLERLSSQSKEEAENYSLQRKIEASLKAFQKLLDKLSQMRGELIELNNELNLAKKQLMEIGFGGPDPILTPLIDVKLKEKLKQEKQTLLELVQTKEELKKLLSISEELGNLFDDLEERVRGIYKTSKFELPTYKSITKIDAQLAVIGNVAAEDIQKFKLEIAAIKSNLSKEEKEILSLSKFLDECKQQLDELKGRIELIENLNRQFEENWNQLSEDDVSRTNLKKLSQGITQNDAQLEEANKLFKEIREALDKALDLERNEDLNRKYASELKRLEQEKNRIETTISYYKDLIEGISILQEQVRQYIKDQIEPLSETISSLYLRAQGNQVVNNILVETNPGGTLDWIAELGEKGEKLDNMVSLSQGQRQDLALAIFLARARKLGGTFFLDEPLVHLDDLNRIALLDTLRVILSERNRSLNLVITTSSNNLVRHLREKFSLISPSKEIQPVMRIYKLSGSPKTGNNIECDELPAIHNTSISRLLRTK